MIAVRPRQTRAFLLPSNIVGNIDLTKNPPEDFLPFYEQIPEGSAKGQGARRLIRKWLKIDGQAAIEWGESLDIRSRGEALGHYVVGEWARMPESREWLRSAPESPFSQNVIRRIVKDMNDPAQARAWMNELPTLRADQVREALDQGPQ